MKCVTIDDIFFEMQLQSVSLHECKYTVKCKECKYKVDCDMTIISINMILRGEY